MGTVNRRSERDSARREWLFHAACTATPLQRLTPFFLFVAACVQSFLVQLVLVRSTFWYLQRRRCMHAGVVLDSAGFVWQPSSDNPVVYCKSFGRGDTLVWHVLD